MKNKEVNKEVNIELIDWYYQCTDGCCSMYGVKIKVNGKECENEYAGDNVEASLKFTLEQLGYKVNIENI